MALESPGSFQKNREGKSKVTWGPGWPSDTIQEYSVLSPASLTRLSQLRFSPIDALLPSELMMVASAGKRLECLAQGRAQ